MVPQRGNDVDLSIDDSIYQVVDQQRRDSSCPGRMAVTELLIISKAFVCTSYYNPAVAGPWGRRFPSEVIHRSADPSDYQSMKHNIYHCLGAHCCRDAIVSLWQGAFASAALVHQLASLSMNPSIQSLAGSGECPPFSSPLQLQLSSC